MAETSIAWLSQSWSTLGLFALVGMSLMFMFTWVRAQTPVPDADREFALGFGLEVPAAMGDSLELSGAAAQANEEGESGPKSPPSGGEIKEELSTMIKQNPDAAVNLLRSWIGEAA